MTTLTIKDVPEPLAEQLRQRAARNHRSLQGELMSIIEQAAREDQVTSAPVAGAPTRPPGVRRGWKSIDQIYAEMRAKYPEPIYDQSNSIQLIREDRDSR